MTSQNAREIILTWIRERLKDSPAFTLPEVTDEVLETFGEDHQLISALLRTHLRGVIYELVQKAAAEGRSLVVHGVHIDPTRADEAHQKLRDDFWGRVYENIRGQQKPLLDLTYDDLKE